MDFLKLTILILTIAKVKSDVSSLQDEQHQNENLDPLQQQDANDTQHDQNKRTLCQTFNKCQTNQPTSAYVKRLVIKGGYSLRPTGLGYRYPKPKVQFRLRAPAVLRPTGQGWKQFNAASKPAIVEVPAPDLRPMVDHVHHGNHVDVQPSLGHHHGVHPAVVSVPAPPPAVAPSILAPQAFLPAPQAFIPAPLPPPAPILFEVTKPHLGVLPLGARFNVPPLLPQPHYHLQPQPHFHLQPQPHYHPQPGLSVEYHGTRNFLPLPHHPHQVVQPHQFAAHAHFLQPHEHLSPIQPQEHHNYFLQQALPHDHHGHFIQPQEHHTQIIQPQALPHEHHIQFVQPHEHHTQFVQPQSLPHEHQAQFFHQQQAQSLPHEHHTQFVQPQSLHHTQFVQPQSLPHEHQAQFLQQQSLPYEHQAQFLEQQAQSLPHEHQAQFLQSQTQFLQSQSSSPQDYQNAYGQSQSHYPVEVPQYQLPLEGEEPQVNNVIQPGQTDVQIPSHLPQHWRTGEK